MLNDDELLIIDAAVKAFKIQMRAHSKSQRRFWVVFSMNFFLALLNVIPGALNCIRIQQSRFKH